MDRAQRVRSLDTLRAVAIILVFIAHTVKAFWADSILAPLQLGGTGVDLFFVLSGYLLGTQLIKAMDQESGIQVFQFYKNRWIRTLPLYYAVLSLTLLQQQLLSDEPIFSLYHLFFLQNLSLIHI